MGGIRPRPERGAFIRHNRFPCSNPVFKAYEAGIKKADYWTYTLEDCLTLIARLPALAARIYRNVYKRGAVAPPINRDLDLVGNYTALMGYGANKDLTEYLRLYISIHGD